MTGKTCKVKDELVAQLIVLNGKLTALGPGSFRDDRARVEIQQERESLYDQIKLHRKKGHKGKSCPAIQRYPYP